MDTTQYKTHKRAVRHRRLRARITGTANRPRLAVYRSNRSVYAQLIDDTRGHTLAAADSRQETGSQTEAAAAVGERIAKLAHDAGISAVVFDRGGFRYQGTIATLADAARNAGLQF